MGGPSSQDDSLNGIVLSGLGGNSRGLSDSEDGTGDGDEEVVPATSEDEQAAAATWDGRKKSPKKRRELDANRAAAAVSFSTWNSQKVHLCGMVPKNG